MSGVLLAGYRATQSVGQGFGSPLQLTVRVPPAGTLLGLNVNVPPSGADPPLATAAAGAAGAAAAAPPATVTLRAVPVQPHALRTWMYSAWEPGAALLLSQESEKPLGV